MKELFAWSNKLNIAFWSRVSNSTKEGLKSVCVYRIIVGLFLLTYPSSNISWIGRSPQAFFNPPVLSIATFFNGFPPPFFFTMMQLLLIVFTIFITLGIKTRVSIFVYIAISIITKTFLYSFGKIDHSIMITVVLFCMSFSGWGSHLALVPDKYSKTDSTEKSLSLLGVLICFAFFSAGFEKALNWVNFDLSISGSANWFYKGYYILQRQHLLAPLFSHQPFWGFKIMDFIAVIFELSPMFFLLKSKKAWRLWLLVACTFHMVNTLVLNINFLGFSIIYLAFFDYTFLFSKFKALPSLSLYKIGLLLWLSVAVTYKIIQCFSPIPTDMSFDEEGASVASLYFSVFCWIVVILIIYWNTFKKVGYQNAKHSPYMYNA